MTELEHTCLAVFMTKTVGRLAGMESLVTSGGVSGISGLTISFVGLSFSGVKSSFLTLVTVLGGSGSKYFIQNIKTTLYRSCKGTSKIPEYYTISGLNM